MIESKGHKTHFCHTFLLHKLSPACDKSSRIHMHVHNIEDITSHTKAQGITRTHNTPHNSLYISSIAHLQAEFPSACIKQEESHRIPRPWSSGGPAFVLPRTKARQPEDQNVTSRRLKSAMPETGLCASDIKGTRTTSCKYFFKRPEHTENAARDVSSRRHFPYPSLSVTNLSNPSGCFPCWRCATCVLPFL